MKLTRITKRFSAVIFAGMMLWFMCISFASATTFIELTLKEMCSLGSDIIVGRVVSVQSYLRSEQNRIFTDIELEVNDVIKGNLPKGELIRLTMYGGTVNGTTTFLVGAPHFSIDEQSLLILFRTPSLNLSVIGLSQGKFDIFIDHETREEKVIRDQIEFPLQLEKDGPRLPLTNKQALAMSDMLTHIQAYVNSK